MAIYSEIRGSFLCNSWSRKGKQNDDAEWFRCKKCPVRFKAVYFEVDLPDFDQRY
jgi:hypothetical protein